MGRIANLLLIGFTASRMWAASVSVTDPFNIPGNSDVFGNKLQFDGQSVQVTTGPGSLTIDVRTNFDNSGLHSFRDTGVRLDIGDLFFTVNGNYSYGIPLAYHNGPAGGPWGDRLYAGHVYAIDNPGALLTARETLHDPMYVEYRPDAIVWMVDLGGVHDVTAGTPTVQVLSIAGNDGVNGPLYDIRVSTSLPEGLFSSPGDNYGLSFAVATCGNDMIQGALNFDSGLQFRSAAVDSAVPEPSTWYMMIGAVLVGVARFVASRR
jgi:PEP-CTERM motif-containing protein